MSQPRVVDATCPLSREQVIDRYFLEHRQKLIDVAAFLDRVERAAGESVDDHRLAALRRAIRILDDGQPRRAQRILEALSDRTNAPVASARGLGPATGAPQRPS